MGFGSLFLGFMFLYDFQVGLRAEGSEGAYALLDIFPDPIGWLLILLGLLTLSKKAEGFGTLRRFPVFFLALSVFTFLKDTLLFNLFYTPEGVQNFVGSTVDFCEHLLTLAFFYLFFTQTALLCRKQGEDKLSRSHAMVPRIAMTEGALFLLARLGSYLSLPTSLEKVFLILSRLDFLFWVFLVWFAVISLVRAMLRISE